MSRNNNDSLKSAGKPKQVGVEPAKIAADPKNVYTEPKIVAAELEKVDAEPGKAKWAGNVGDEEKDRRRSKKKVVCEPAKIFARQDK